VLVPGRSTVADLSERELIARIRQPLAPAPDWLLVGIGDDAAVVEPQRNRVEVLSVDAIVEGIHFDRAFVPPDAIGHRALAVNLSDLAAMGASPRLALLSMALPAGLPIADFDAIAAGFAALAARHTLHLVGGNLTRSPGPLMIDVTVMGTVKRRQAMTRGGARPGDDLYVTGTIGSAAAGLALLRERAAVISHQSSVASQQSSVASLSRQTDDGKLKTDDLGLKTDDLGLKTDDLGLTTDNLGLTTDDLGLTTDDLRLTTAYLFPSPRVRAGLLMSRTRAAAACMDLSDGLADAAHQMADASGVGVTIDAALLPIDAAARAFFEARGMDPVFEALTGGDDYELLLAIRPRGHRRFAAAARHGGVPVTRVGRCTDAGAVVLQSGASGPRPLPQGYSHFR
jgi:thiamine-monophosphate kinase